MLVEGVAHTLCLMSLFRKKANGFRSDERGDHSTQPLYQIICCWNVFRRYCWILDTLCGGVPSCWNHKFRRSLKSSTKSDIASSRSSKYRDPVNLPYYNTGPIILFLDIPQQTFIDQRTWFQPSTAHLRFSIAHDWMFCLLYIILREKLASSFHMSLKNVGRICKRFMS